MIQPLPQVEVCAWCGCRATHRLTSVNLDVVTVTFWCAEHIDMPQRGARARKALGYGGAWRAEPING